MKLELIGGTYYVNKQRIAKETLRSILIEVWSEEIFNYIVEKLQSNGVFNITWHGNKLVKTRAAELEKERRKNQLLTAKLNAVELAFLGKSA